MSASFLARLSRIVTPALALAAAPAAFANKYDEPPVPPIGTTTVATADLFVSRPPTTPCSVTLMSNQEFAGFDPVALSYVPPAACPGPWAKVVLEADYSVTAGVQFDRTGLINLGGVNIYFGTTMEPGSQTARAWHVERDLTDYTATLLTAQSGQAILGNVVDSTYTGRIFGSATLKFYPAGRGAPVTPAAQLVLPLAPSVTSLSPTNPTLSATLTLPRNIERLYLDVIAQSQGDDEFWYTCVPDQYASVLQSCPGGAFREVEVSIDGTPAGVAPVYPWIYTGGISPSLWAPTPGVQTLNFDPYRVDLTPFAGTLNDGQPHTVAVQVYGAQDSFSVTGTLLAWRDAGAPVVTGAVTGNTLTAPTVNVNAAGLRINGSSAKGPLIVSSARSYVISGSVNTSHGVVTTQVTQNIGFTSTQRFNIGRAQYVQNINQQTHVNTVTATTDASGTATSTVQLQYPLTLVLSDVLSRGGLSETIAITQTLKRNVQNVDAAGKRTSSVFLDTVSPQMVSGASGNSSSSSQHYSTTSTTDGCYDRTISVTFNAVSAVTDGCSR